MKTFSKIFTGLCLSSSILFSSLLFCGMDAAAASKPNPSKTTSITSMIPSCLVVEQTVTLDSGKTVTVYYKKSGNICELYSAADLKGYNMNDLLSMTSTNLRLVSAPKGKLVYKTTMAQACNIIKSLVNTFL
ncbi:MAG: hypothetical protein K2J03_02125 [Muribaculaceae bacterium]|nr:hypothetical protein [Muribaculaceae bacterium]